MIRHLAAILVLALVGLPFLAAPSWLVGTLGAVAAVLCAAGILVLSIPLLALGASLGLIQYALALWLSAGPPDLLVALGLGVALSLLLQVVEFGGRFRGAALAPGVVREQIRDWVATEAVAATAGIVLTIVAGSVTFDLPPPAYPAVAAVGALGAFLGAARILARQADHHGATRADEKR
jgi:hypothetical protein